jgi:monoamine oxidase
MDTLPDIDIAIVGAGIGGVYTGWQLLTSGSRGSRLGAWAAARGGLKVALFEGSRRIGGRLLSARSPLLPDTTAEIGGMRYVSPAQTRIRHLVEDVLQLPTHEQTVDVDSNIAFLRGRQLRISDLADPTKLPYWFDQSETEWLRTQKTPAALIGRVLTTLMPDIAKRLEQGTLREYLGEITIDGLPLWQHGLWNLIARGMSIDGYAAARTTVGYDCLGGNTNALDLTTTYFDFTPGVHYRMVDGGYETVPWLLCQRFVSAGGDLRLGHWLDGFSGTSLADGTKGVHLAFRDKPGMTARAIILAMPRRAIELLLPEGEVLGHDNRHFRENLATVQPIPLSKLFMLYPRCWWQEAGVTAGRSLTDLPLRQCYYWPSGPNGTTVPKATAPGLVMAYDDAQSVDFWHGLDSRHVLPLGSVHRVRDRWPMFTTAGAPRPPAGDDFSQRLIANWTDHPATVPMVREMHRQLMLMHGVRDAPEPIDAAYMDWTHDPFGGGVHLWNVNHQSVRLLREMIQPVADFPCYICGEAYSTNQTWAEGALQTADLVLDLLFDRAAAGGVNP